MSAGEGEGGGKGTNLELPDLYLPVVTVWLITLVLTPPPPESSSLVVLVPLTLLDVLADYERLSKGGKGERWDIPKLADVKVGSASVGSGSG